MRILRIELRRSIALWSALLIAAVWVFVLFASNPSYRSWMELVLTQRDIMQLTWPLALGAGAWQGLRERRSRVEELVGTTPRPRWVRVLPVAGAMAIGAIAMYLVALGAASPHLRHLIAYFPAGGATLVALGALAMVAGVWLGLAIGSLLPSPLTPPLLVVSAFIGLAVLPPLFRDQNGNDAGAALLLPSLPRPQAGAEELMTLSSRAFLMQALWLAAFAATALALFAARTALARGLAFVPVLAGAAVVVALLPAHADVAWVEDHAATEVICTADGPRICAPRAYSFVFGPLREPAGQALAALAKLPAPQTRVLVAGKDNGHAADTLVVSLDLLAETPRTSDSLLWTMVDGAGVPVCEMFEGNDKRADLGYVAARAVAAAWLLDRDLPQSVVRGGEPMLALQRQILAALRALPAAEQRSRIAALRDAERTCAPGDRVELLTGTRG